MSPNAAQTTMVPIFEIGGRPIGPGHPAYIVAEMSANHGQGLDQAARIVEAAAAAGADAVKIQSYTPDTMTIDCEKPHFRIEGSQWNDRVLYELYAEAQTPWEWHEGLAELASGLGMHFFSTPFDVSAVDHLERMAVPAYKIASFEIVDLPLLRRVAATGKPVIVSTGMASLEEIEEAVACLREGGAQQIALLKCSSAYPAPPASINLRTIPAMSERFGVPVGFSDHTLGTSVAIGAVASGACIVEKHLTLRRADGGPDASFSAEPDELADLVEGIRTVEAALGEVQYGPQESEAEMLLFRRSLFAVADIKAGEPFTERNVRSIRPGNGLHPRHLEEVLGRRAARDVERGDPLTWDAVSPPEQAKDDRSR